MQPIDVSTMSTACRYCGAHFWRDESMWCCHAGKIKFKQEDLPPQVPDPLFTFLTINSPEAKHFRKNIRQYNAALAMTSMNTSGTMMKGAAESGNKVPGREPCMFRVHGEVYHR